MISQEEYNLIENWFNLGKDIKLGLELHYRISKNHANKMRLATKISMRKYLLENYMKELLNSFPKKIDKPVLEKQPEKNKIIPKKQTEKIPVEIKLKEEFPRLNFNKLPDTLKLLVFERYRLWEESKINHQKQHDAVTCEDRFNAVKSTILAIKENWQIWDELNHYHKFTKVLGKHHKFNENAFFKYCNDLETKSLSEATKEFMKIRKRARNNINRLKLLYPLNDRQQAIMNDWIYKHNIVSKKLNEPLWE